MHKEYEEKLKLKDEQIEYYKDFKARQSTKMIGESLEQHCLNQFNSLRMTAFPAAYFEKDNWSVLAKYKTEERAKEVLQEIAQKYSSYLKLEGGPAILQGQMDIQPNIFNIPKVYEMPED